MGAKIEIRLRSGEARMIPLGNGPALVTAGGARFEQTERAERKSLSDYQGDDLIEMDVPVFFDGWRGQIPIEADLWWVTGLAFGHDGKPPPNFRALGPIPHTEKRWVMHPAEWGDGERGASGLLVRQAITLKLLEWEDPSQINLHRSKVEQLHNKPRTVTLPRPMTCVEIAAHYLQDPHRGKEVAKLNGLHDPTKKLPKGSKVKIPG